MRERGVIGIITRSTGETRTTYLLKDIVAPTSDDDVYIDTRQGHPRLLFSPGYRTRATARAAEVSGGGLVYFHSHPGGSAYPSDPDLRADRTRLYNAAKNLGPDVPLAAGIIAERPRRESGHREWSFRAYEFDTPATVDDPDLKPTGEESARQRHATAIRVVGPGFQKLATTHTSRAAGPAGISGRVNPTEQDSAVQLWGKRGQFALSGVRVGVVGCGGVGSYLAAELAMLGVGGAVFVDFDRVKPVNRNRALGATKEDARHQRPKAEVARRVAEQHATAPGFEARAVVGSIVENQSPEHAAVGDLLDCDVILNAADPHWVRMVVDELARAHLIPVINGGTDLRADKSADTMHPMSRSEITATGPVHPCFECQNVWMWGDREEGVIRDKKPPADRGGGPDLYAEPNDDDGADAPRDPSVAPTNGLVASIMAERLQALIVGTTTETIVGGQRYRLYYGTMQWRSSDGERRTECRGECTRPEATARGDTHDLGTGHDYDLRRELDAFTSIHDELPGKDS
nr:ThiF family adenylyltransferase [Natrinema caseinilyticum]